MLRNAMMVLAAILVLPPWAHAAGAGASAPAILSPVREAIEQAVRQDPWMLGVPGLLLALILAVRLARGWFLRDAGRPRAAGPRAEPPAGLTPAEAHVLLNRRAAPAAIAGSLLDLAVRGHLAIEPVEQQRIFGRGTDFQLHRRTPRHRWLALAAHEQALLHGVFRWRPAAELGEAVAAMQREQAASAAPGSPTAAEGGFFERIQFGRPDEDEEERPVSDAVRLSAIVVRLQGEARDLEWSVHERLFDRGCYRSEPGAGAGLMRALAFGMPPLVLVVLGLAGFAAYFLGFLDVDPFALGAIWFASMFLLPAVASLLFLKHRVAGRSDAGVAVLGEVMAFREYLEGGAAGGVGGGDADEFERWLPHAVALGVEDRWAAVFDGRVVVRPDWFRTAADAGLQPAELVRALKGFIQLAGRAAPPKRRGP